MGRQKSYYELLKDPRWQRKRLEVMDHAQFTCEYCDAEDQTLNIHHTYYEKGLTPWEYPNESLVCLCERCHKQAQSMNVLLQRQIGKLGVWCELEQLIGYAQGLSASNDSDIIISIHGEAWAEGVGHVFGLTAWEVINALEECCIDGHKLKELQDQKAYKSFGAFYATAKELG